MRISDWSSDVCSSDLAQIEPPLDAFDALGQMIDANVTFGRAFFGVGHVTAQSCHRNLESAEARYRLILLALDAHKPGRKLLQMFQQQAFDVIGHRAISFRPEEDRKRTRLNSSH